MKLLKPDWTNHGGKPIYSVDVHPDGTKFATGGQGDESGRVVIWNMKPILTVEAEMDKNVPKILCKLDNHLACVNCVRWSMNGMLLASGGDDKVIMIWKKSKGPSSVFGNAGITKTMENWRCISTLRGHGGDVLDLAWSSQDRWLASSSVDNNIIVWDMHKLPAIAAILKGHTSLVKGVTWDPVGKFLASQSDDRSVKIWKTADWTCHSTITDPFEECGGTTHVLRLSWSPDGLYIVSAHAMNGGGPTAQIIERDGFKCDKDFVGHRKAVTCVRFHNSILKRQAPKTNKSQQYCCLAIGSRDRSLSVWMTALQRPLVVLHDLFEDSILDLSWSTDQNILLACSTDGTVACLQFTANELGTPLTEDDKNFLFQREYGKNIDINAQPEKDMIVEYAELINVNNEKSNNGNGHHVPIEINNANVESPGVGTFEIPTTPIKAAIHKQIETRTADGKRRITPMFIPLDQDVAETGPSNIIIAKSPTIENQFSVPIESSIPSPSVVPKRESDTKIIETKFTVSTNLDNRLTKQAPIRSNTMSKVVNPDSTLATTSIPCSTTKTIKTTILNAGKAVPLQGNFVKSILGFKIQIANANKKTNFGPLSKVNCLATSMTPNQQLWEIFVGSPIVNFCLSSKYVLICSQDGTLRFLDIKTGIQVLPILKLPTPVVQCSFSFNSELGGVVSECGIVRIWNVTQQSVFLTTFCKDILDEAHVAHFYITELGVPFILLSNGCSYSYSKKLESWLVVNSRDPVLRHGLSTIPMNSNKNIRIFPLNTVQTNTHNFQPRSRSFADIATNDWHHTAKLSFIENQIKICEAINSPSELEHWYSLLGSHLSCHGTEKAIRLLLDNLLGPSFAFGSMAKRAKKNDCILGVSKHKLLDRVLEHFRRTPRWQRIYMEYAEQLNELKKESADGDDGNSVILTKPEQQNGIVNSHDNDSDFDMDTKL